MPLVRSVGKKAFSLLLIPVCGCCCCCCSTHGLPCQLTIENEHSHWTREVHLLAMNWMFEFQAWMNFENESHWTREFISCRWFGCLSSRHERWEWTPLDAGIHLSLKKAFRLAGWVAPNQQGFWSCFRILLKILTLENEPFVCCVHLH